jgi:hypothetical protein
LAGALRFELPSRLRHRGRRQHAREPKHDDGDLFHKLFHLKLAPLMLGRRTSLGQSHPSPEVWQHVERHDRRRCTLPFVGLRFSLPSDLAGELGAWARMPCQAHAQTSKSSPVGRHPLENKFGYFKIQRRGSRHRAPLRRGVCAVASQRRTPPVLAEPAEGALS